MLAHICCFLSAFSLDGQNWTFSETEPFGGTVRFHGAPPITFSTRERPKFVFRQEEEEEEAEEEEEVDDDDDDDDGKANTPSARRPKMTWPVGLITGVSASCSPASASCCARCNRTTIGTYSPSTCSQCKHGWQHCENGHCYGGSKGGMDYTYTVFEPLTV